MKIHFLISATNNLEFFIISLQEPIRLKIQIQTDQSAALVKSEPPDDAKSTTFSDEF